MKLLIATFETYCKDILNQSPHEWVGLSATAWASYKKNGVPDKHIHRIYDYFQINQTSSHRDLTEAIVNKYYLDMMK